MCFSPVSSGWACCVLMLLAQAGANAAGSVSGAAGSQPAGVPAEPTCAVLAEATAGLDSSPVVALLETKLSQDSRVRLVERAEITRILAEHSLSLSLAESTPKSRREWGQVLRAQMLVLLQTRQVKEGKVIEAGFVETRHGLSLGSERLVWDDRAEQIASLLARRTSQVAGTLGAGVKHVFAVPPFEAEDLSPDSLQYQSAYAQLVEETLSHLPGVVMADLAHAAEVARELAVSEGETSVARSLPYYLHGRHKMTGPTGNRTVSFHLELRHGQETIASIDKEAIHPDFAASFLRESCTELARKVSGSARQAPVNGATALEADLLEERCKAYRLVGEWESSIRMAEAALLLDPGRHELRASVIWSYQTLIEIWSRRHFDWMREFDENNEAAREKRLATRPYDPADEPVPLTRFLQCALTAIDHETRLTRADLRFSRATILNDLVNRVWMILFNSLRTYTYDWHRDSSGLVPLIHDMTERYLELLLQALSSGRFADERFSMLRGRMAKTVYDLACDQRWSTPEKGIEAIRRIVLTVEPMGESFAIQWQLFSLARGKLRDLPEPVRKEFLRELAERQEGKTRFLVDCTRVLDSLQQQADQAPQLQKQLDAIAAHAFPGESIPPSQMKEVYRTFDMIHEHVKPKDQVPQRRELVEDAASLDNTVQFSVISNRNPQFGSGLPFNWVSQWLQLNSGIDVVGHDRVEIMIRPWEQKDLGSFENGWPHRGDVQWDGRYLWVSNMIGRGRLHVFEGVSWRPVAVFEEADGLPAMERGCKIAPLAAGRVCVAGSTGESRLPQAWLAVVELSGTESNAPRKSVDVFFNARQGLSRDQENRAVPFSLECGFVPTFAVAVRSGKGQMPFVLVGRGGYAPALLVDTSTRHVLILPDRWESRWCYIPGPDRLYVLTYRETEKPLTPVVAEAQLPDTNLREVIALDQPSWEFTSPSAGVLDGRLLHALGREWFTVDLDGPRLVRKAAVDKRLYGCKLSRSNFYGLVAHNHEGAWQVRFGSGKTATMPAMPITEGPESRIVPDGALVAWLPNRGQGEYDSQAIKLEIGDVIIALDGQKVSSAESFVRASAGKENKRRTIEVANEAGRRKVTLEAGAIGVYLCDYRASYGTALTTAIHLCRDQAYAKARKAFEGALAAGLDCKQDDILSLLYARCLYYTGDTARACKLLDERINIAESAKDRRAKLWEVSRTAFDLPYGRADQNYDGHLGLYLRQRALQQDQDDLDDLREVSHYQQQVLHNYPAALPVWLKLMSSIGESDDKKLKCATLDHLFIAFRALKMEPEFSAMCWYLADSGRGNTCFRFFDETLLKADQPDAAVRAWEGINPDKNKPVLSNRRTQRIVGTYALTGRVREARQIIKRLGRSSSPLPMASLVASEALLIGWEDLAQDYAAYARRMIVESPDEPEILTGAFMILSHLPDPDVGELTRVYERVESLVQKSGSPETHSFTFPHSHGMKLTLSMLRGDYDTVADPANYGSTTDLSTYATEREAAIYLKSHKTRLAEAGSPFVRTQYAMRIPSSGWLLLTRDNRIGWTSPDGDAITEIPLPDPTWAVAPGAVRRSNSGKTVIAISTEQAVHVLDPARLTWTRLIRFNKAFFGTEDLRNDWLNWFQPVLDEFQAFVMGREEPDREFVWPPRDKRCYHGAKAMLSDGTWIVTGTRGDRNFFDLSKICAQALGKAVEIYEMSDLTGDVLVYLYTSQGVLKWRRADNQIVPIPFPDRIEPAPVFPLTEGGERLKDKVVRLAVLPDAGGAIYQLDLVEGKLTRDAGINQCYPMTYWLQKPVEWNRQQVIDAVTKAGLPWPPPWLPIQTAESQPARR